MVWAFPKPCMVVAGVDLAMRIAAPIPLAVLMVNEVVLNILPAAQSLVKSRAVIEILVYIIESHHGLCLHPPVWVPPS